MSRSAVTVVYLGETYAVSPCDGEAHDPAYGGMIDHCASCAPSWRMMVRKKDGSRPSLRVHRNVMNKYERYMEKQKCTG